MIDHLVRDLQVLRKADFLIGRIWAGVLLRRAGLVALAGLIAVFGLGMANVAGFHALQPAVGPAWAAAAIALVDLAIAALVLLAAGRARPGPELDLAFEVRKMAVESLEADTRELRLAVETLGRDLKDVRENVTRMVNDPLDVAARKLLVPAILSILKGMRSGKQN